MPEESKIIGYRDLPQHRIDLINEIKRHEADIAVFYKRLREHLPELEADLNLGRVTPAALSESQRQLSIARTSLEAGFSHMVRAVAAPDSPWI